jgi:hypothetical protein
VTESITVIKKDNVITVVEQVNKVTVSTSGMQGPRGSAILNGSGLPSNSIGLAGDYYLDTITDILYGPKTTSWPNSGVSIRGATGPTGATGQTGYSVYTGTSTPSNSLGNNGDAYIQSTANLIYSKISGIWTNAQAIVPKSSWSFTYEQQSNSTTWIINHNLAYNPSVDIIDYSGNNLEADIAYTSLNSLTVTLSSPTSGYAYLA